MGLLAKITQVFAEYGINVLSANIKTTREKRAICFFDIRVSDSEQFKKVLANISKIDGVIAAERISL